MADLVFVPRAHPHLNERLAAAAELAEFRAMGLRPAPHRQLVRVAPAPPATRPYAIWHLFAIVAFQLVALVAAVVIR